MVDDYIIIDTIGSLETFIKISFLSVRFLGSSVTVRIPLRGFPKITNFKDLRWICLSASFQKWFKRSVKFVYDRSWSRFPRVVLSYGFFPNRRSDEVSGMISEGT